MARFSIPTTGRLSPDARLPTSSITVQKALSRLSRSSLLNLIFAWISDENAPLCAPSLGEDTIDDVFYQPAETLEELRSIYTDLQSRKGSKREVIDRITEGDWKQGLTLHQLAMADAQYLQDHPTSQKWTAYRILPIKPTVYAGDEEQPPEADKESLNLPRFHPSTFIDKLQSHVLPDVKAHYHIHRPQDLPLAILRIFIIESPYNTSMLHLGNGSVSADSDIDSSRTLYIAFPDGSPYIYLSKSQTTGPLGAAESKSFRNLVVEGIPKALSRPRERYMLKPTNVSTKNITALLYTRGNGRTNAAGGGWNIYADRKKNESPLNTLLPTPPLSEESSDDSDLYRPAGPKRKMDDKDGTDKFTKRARLCAQARFGDTAHIDDGLGIERMDITIEDPFPRSMLPEEEDGSRGEQSTEKEAPGWTPNVKLTFHGFHVFAGMRQLIESGIIDGQRMPGWLTGEEGVTVGAVRHGRIRGHKGSGM
ncbi:chl4 family chromosome segregation [Colletotrichum sojae]|uniref:Chl4 family chromosome segregation n=1 Tax=Colletotrichum sojae TaxID=2175907 RepID=A0A8H6JZI0_9PEZI|nr:chl4 family chromosome segregation [Colletotrichum sojae]